MSNKELTNKLKKEAMILLILYLLGLIIFKFIFNKEQLGVVIKVVFGLFWLFVLPGFSLMYYWHDKLDFTERAIIGTAMSLALIGIMSYHAGLIGLHVKNHAIVFPLVILVGGILVIRKKLVSN